VLNLQIRQEFLSLIMKGEKKQEFREIRPTTEKKFIQLDEEGFALEDPERFITNVENIEVETRMNDEGVLCVVYNTEEDEEVLYPVFMAKNDEGVEYEAINFMDKTFEVVRAAGDKEEDLLDENGNPLMAIVNVEELHSCVPVKYDAINFYVGNKPDTDHALVEVKDTHTEFYIGEDGAAQWYEYNDERYYLEEIVFDLGEIICEYKAGR